MLICYCNTIPLFYLQVIDNSFSKGNQKTQTPHRI